jgi:hypothetical protein
MNSSEIYGILDTKELNEIDGIAKVSFCRLRSKMISLSCLRSMEFLILKSSMEFFLL